MIAVVLYIRKDCHLCEQTQTDLASLQKDYPHTLQCIDVDSSAELHKTFSEHVPVLTVGPYMMRAPIERAQLAMTLGAATDRQRHIDQIESSIEQGVPGQKDTWTRSDSFTHWMSKHYLAVFNAIVIVYLGLPLLAPAFMKAGLDTPASLIYRVYGGLCHQLSFRSFFIFGEQPVYPRSAAGMGSLLSFQQATGLSEGNDPDALLAARMFVGNPLVGYKVALCERDVLIYGSMLLFGILFAITGRKLKSLPWYIWVLIGILPIALDGFSQLFSQPPFNFLPYRESTPYMRMLTGFLFGFATAWFGYPLVETSMAESRRAMDNKRNRVRLQTEAARSSGRGS